MPNKRKLPVTNRKTSLGLLFALVLSASFPSCAGGTRQVEEDAEERAEADSLAAREQFVRDSVEAERTRPLTAADITVEKEFLFEDYLLEDSYPYKDTIRVIKWDKIRENLAAVENAQKVKHKWGVIQNYKNLNGEAPLVHTWHRNEYKLVSDSLNIARYQSVPLYRLPDSVTPRRYGRDGTPVVFRDSVGGYYTLSLYDSDEEWTVPKKYVHFIPDSATFGHVVFVDRSDQNIVTMERAEKGRWLVRSTNPCTTGKHNPPFQMETPLGTFLVQQKKVKMFYTHDGSSRIAGYAPYASRFTNGGYLHGVPVNHPNGKIIEYSASLGTTPRSHMCVRNASSHAKFIYDNFPTEETLVVVID